MTEAKSSFERYYNDEGQLCLKDGTLVQSQVEQFRNISPPGMAEITLARHGTEHSMALAFVEQFRNSLRYDHNSNTWYGWADTHWQAQRTGLVSHYCRQICATHGDGKLSERRAFVSGVEAFCKNDPAFAVTSDIFDLDNYLLNTPDGTYDLRTGICRDHRQSDLITNITGVSPGVDYGVRFPTFLDEITCGSKELAEFLQIALGACLSGAIEGHWMMFWIGNGRNGKNTLGDLVMRAMGSYARKIPSSTLMKSKHENHPTDLANLAGCRLAVASEVDPSAFWNESRINEITGDEQLSARFMRGDFFEFKRTFKLLVYGNHRPRLNSVTPAIRGRIKMVRFSADFSNKGDPDLPAKLNQELGCVLRWLIDGHIKWVNNGKSLANCSDVDSELDDYFDAQSTTANWASEALERMPYGSSVKVKSSDLYRMYSTWKKDRGEQPESTVRWAEEMSKCGFEKHKSHGCICYFASIRSGVVTP